MNRPPKESTVAAIKALAAHATPPTATAAATPTATEPAAAAARRPKQSAIDAAKQGCCTTSAPVPTRPPPTQHYVARANAADRQGAIEAAKLRRGGPQAQPAPPYRSPTAAGSSAAAQQARTTQPARSEPPHALVDDVAQLGAPLLLGLARARPERRPLNAEVLVSALTLRLRVPGVSREDGGVRRTSSIGCLRGFCGRCLCDQRPSLQPPTMTVRLLPPDAIGGGGGDAIGDEEEAVEAGASIRQSRPTPTSVVDWEKRRRLPGRTTPIDAPRAPPHRYGSGSCDGGGPRGVDAWGAPVGGRWRVCIACGHDRSLCFALVASLSKCASQPPFAAPKLMGSVPLLLVCTWISVLKPLPLGPLAPFAAVGLAVPALIIQCYLVSFPLTAGLAGLAFDLVEAVDGAFAALSSGVEGTVARTLKPVHLPLAVEAKVGTVLARPCTAAIHIVRALLPDPKALPPWVKNPRALSPLIFVLLLAALIVVQVMPLLLLGLAGNGDLAIVLCCLVCVQLAVVALKARQVVRLVLTCIEGGLNFTVQFLLRRVISMAKLQALLDAASDPRTALGLVQADRASNEPGNVVDIVPWAHDTTTTRQYA